MLASDECACKWSPMKLLQHDKRILIELSVEKFGPHVSRIDSELAVFQ